MSIALTINGTTYQYPETNNQKWGPDATQWASAVTTGMLQKAGGLFQLLAEVDFGTAFGVKSLYYKTRTANVADAGQIRLARADVISWRNQAADGNLDLSVNSSNVLLFNGVALGNFVSVLDTNSIDLTLSSGVLSSDLKLSSAAATAGSFKVTNSIASDGLLSQATIATTALTGFLSSTDWNTFNNKQPAGNYITALTGDGTAAGPGSAALTLATVNSNVGTFASVTVNGKGLVTAATALSGDATTSGAAITLATVNSNVGTFVATTLNAKGLVTAGANLSGDGTTSGAVLTLATVNSNVGSFGGATTSGTFTVNAKGLITAASSTSIQIAESQVTNLVTDLAAKQSTTLTSAHILVGNVSNVATDVAMSGDITISNAGVTAIGTNKVANSQLAQMAQHTFKGNNTSGTANALDLTATQLTAELNVMTGDAGSGGLKGLVPAQATGDATKFLNGAGAWSTPAGAGDVTGPASATDNGFVKFNGTTGKLVKNSNATIAASEIVAMTVSRAVVSDASGFISPATTTSTEIGYVNGVTSAIQTQINNVYDPTSYSDVNATLFGLKEYNHGTTYNGGIAPTVTSSVSGFTCDKGSFYPYKNQGGTWFMRFEIQGTYTANSHSLANLTVNGITFANEGSNGWAAAFAQGNSASVAQVYCLAVRNASLVQYQMASAISGLTFAVTGWAKLSAKPTWAY